MYIAKDYRLPNLRYFCHPRDLAHAHADDEMSNNNKHGLLSKRSFMDRLLHSKGGRGSETQGDEKDLTMKAPLGNKLWFGNEENNPQA